MEEEQMLTKEQILDMLDAGQYKELKEELGNMYPRRYCRDTGRF